MNCWWHTGKLLEKLNSFPKYTKEEVEEQYGVKLKNDGTYIKYHENENFVKYMILENESRYITLRINKKTKGKITLVMPAKHGYIYIRDSRLFYTPEEMKTLPTFIKMSDLLTCK